MYDDDEYGGCLGAVAVIFIILWISDHWIPIVAAIAVIIAVPLIISGVRTYKEKKAKQEAKAKAEALEKARQEDEERLRKEREAYDRYFSMQEKASLDGKLDAANAIIRKLFEEEDNDKRTKIIAFFDKYLPLMTGIIEAGNHGGTVSDEACHQFTETVKTFSRTLYKADEVIDVNQTTMESLAIVDGLYDPYAEILSFNTDADNDPEV